jgi:HAD superfamily hydrolase (TIGR01509 family)
VLTETLFLDAGGVLLFPNWQRVADVLAGYGVRVEADALARADPHVRKQIDEPDLIRSAPDEKRGRQYFDLVLDKAGVPASEARTKALDALRAYHAQHNLWEIIPSDVIPALERLKTLGLRIAVVSNSNGTLCAHFERIGLSRSVDCVVDSAEVGIEKPDPEIFERTLARLGARRETTVHVGDLYNVDVVGARAAGLRAVLLDPLDLYEGESCERVRSLDELATLLADGRPGKA